MNPRGCEHCGRGGHTTPVRVRPLRADVPDVGSLRLCEGCRWSDARTWRMRWREVSV